MDEDSIGRVEQFILNNLKSSTGNCGRRILRNMSFKIIAKSEVFQ